MTDGPGFDPGAMSGVSTGIRELAPDDLLLLDPKLFSTISGPGGREKIRRAVLLLLCERELILSSLEKDMPQLERSNALSCLRTLRNMFLPVNEKLARCSVLDALTALAEGGRAHQAFLQEVYHIILGSLGLARTHVCVAPDFLRVGGRRAAIMRSDDLDSMAGPVRLRMESYLSGMDPKVVRRREANRERILDALGGSEADWWGHGWQKVNVFRDSASLEGAIDLTGDERAAIDLAVANRIPFGITPYYLSLFDADREHDHAVRAQVIPQLDYVRRMVAHRQDRDLTFDFMREHDTSPVALVTRRYPMIAILKPYNTCAQICVYCQRNWEIDTVLSPDALAREGELESALQWFAEHPEVREVLVTGGDPALMEEAALERVLRLLSELSHIEAIRIGTRLPVVLPMRMTASFLDMLASFHDPPGMRVEVITHYEHPYEVTPESAEAVAGVRARGMNVYNQQVFTFENSRRFETCALRMWLKRIGVDPYYLFNTKGKEETSHYRVPIARILQERKEEARMMPGLTRTDEPVYNLPGLGKNNLTYSLNHEVIMLSSRGERFYLFHPWEKNIALSPTFVYKDVPIHDYLLRLRGRGEDIEEYRTIWYYF